MHAGRQRHFPALPPDVGDIADERGSGDGQAREHAEEFNLLKDLWDPVQYRDRQHARPARLLRYRDPHSDRPAARSSHRLTAGERPACHRSRDNLTVYPGGKRDQHLAGEVPQVNHGVPGRHRRTCGGKYVLKISGRGLPQDPEGVWVAGHAHRGSTQLECAPEQGCAVPPDCPRCANPNLGSGRPPSGSAEGAAAQAAVT